MTAPHGPTKYLGPDQVLIPFVSIPRQPTGADYRQPSTGRYYFLGTIWQVSKNPTTGSEGQLFMLSKIVANVAFWIQIDSTLGEVEGITVDAATPPGVNPVLPNASNLIAITGAQVATGIIGANVIRTHTVALNQFNIEIQQTATSVAKNTTLNGVSHFNSAQFSVDEGFVSLTGSILEWIDTSGAFAAVVNKGYFLTAASTATLPASPAQGDTIRFICDTTGSCVITANTGQVIRISNSVSSAAGTATNTLRGDSLVLVYRAANTTWFSLNSPSGGWNLA